MICFIKHSFPGQNFSFIEEYLSLNSKRKFFTDANDKFTPQNPKVNKFLPWKVVQIKNKTCWWELLIDFSFFDNVDDMGQSIQERTK